jgi:hypothetical protein
MSVDEPSRGSRAILFPRDLFGFQGLGYLDVTADGVTIRWSGWLFRSSDEHHPWDEVTRAKIHGHWFSFRLSTQHPALTALVLRPRRTREALEQWAPPGVLRVTLNRGRAAKRSRGAP